MLDRLRTPLFVLALILAVLAWGAEIGSRMLPASVNVQSLRAEARRQLQNEDLSASERDDMMAQMTTQARSGQKPPGLGVSSVGLLDGLLIYSLVLIGLSLVVPERITGRVQGIVSLIVSILVIIAAIVVIFGALIKLLIMVALFTAAPFGTIAYLAIYGFFNRGGAAAILGLSLFLKFASAIVLVLAHQRFLQNKGLVLLYLTSLLATIIVTFLHGLVPIILVSITDGVAAIIGGILALVWAVALLIGSIVSIVKAIL